MPMDEHRARQILGDMICSDGLCSDALGGNGYLSWCRGDPDACLDAQFTADQLEAIAWWMRHAVRGLSPAAPSGSAWQPIETAPKGEIVLVHDAGYVGKALLDDGGWLDVECGYENARFGPPPTEWQPLPLPPGPERKHG